MCMHVYPCIYVVYAESPEHETLFLETHETLLTLLGDISDACMHDAKMCVYLVLLKLIAHVTAHCLVLLSITVLVMPWASSL